MRGKTVARSIFKRLATQKKVRLKMLRVCELIRILNLKHFFNKIKDFLDRYKGFVIKLRF